MNLRFIKSTLGLRNNKSNRILVYTLLVLCALIVLSGINQTQSHILLNDNDVDTSSNIDNTPNLGSETSGSVEDAGVLDGNYQALLEENSSEIAVIEDYVDKRSNVDPFPASGSISDFNNMQDVGLTESLLEEGGVSENWGDTTQQSSETTVNWMRCMGGNFSLGSSYQVTEVYLSSNTTDGGGAVRLSIYQGGSLTDPNGANLLWDAGTVTADTGYVGIRGGSIPLTNNDPLWICVKGNDDTFNVHFDSTHDPTSDFQSANGRFEFGSPHSTDETAPFESTLNSTGGSFSSFYYSFYVVVEDTNSDRQLDQEVQFTQVIDYLPVETLAIKTGQFTGSEDINVTYWSGSNWTLIASDLTRNAWNNFSVTLNSSTFTIKFGGSKTTADTITDTWEIDAVMLVVSGFGSDEIAIQRDTSNVDNSADSGTIDDFSFLTAKESSYATFSESITPGQITFVRAGGSTGASHNIDIGQPGNNRLVAVIVGVEGIGLSSGGVTIDSKSAIKIAEADNPDGLGNHMELWILTESGLGSSSGTVNVNVISADSLWAVHVMVFYNVRDSVVPYDIGIDETSTIQYEILPSPIDIPENGLVIFGAGNGGFGSYNDNDWDTNPTEITDDGLTPEIEMTEIYDATPPDSAVLAEAYWVSNTTTQTNRQFRARGSTENNRGTGIIASFHPVTYRLDQEFQWQDIPYQQASEELAIYTGNLASEDLLVDYWNGSGWENLFAGLSPNSWNNISITKLLNTDVFTIRFRDGVSISDNSSDVWEIDVVLISYLSTNTNYRLEWEHQVNSLELGREEYDITIYGYSSNTSESFLIQLWNATASNWLKPLNLQIGTTLQWYNTSINYNGVIGETVTYRLVGEKDQPYDLEQTTLYIDYAGIASYDDAPIFVSPPDDFQIIEDTTGNTLSWNVYDKSPNNYSINLNGQPLVPSTPWANYTITINIDGLNAGDHVYNLTLEDEYGYTSSDTVTVTVLDILSPSFIQIPSDFTYSEDSTGNELSWNVSDKHPNLYDLYLNGSLTGDSGTWNNEANITANIDGLTKGYHNYTLVVTDESNNPSTSSVFVTVIDVTDPQINAAQSNITYAEGSIGNTLNWNITDNHPETYDLYRNGSLIINSGIWNSVDNITISIDGLQKGNYNFTLVVYDESNNQISTTVFVTVLDMTPPTILDSSGDVAYPEGYNGNYIWWNVTDNYPNNYTLYLNGDLYTTGNWIPYEVLLVDVDGLFAGDHNFTINFYDVSQNFIKDTIIVTVVSEKEPPKIIYKPSNVTFYEGTTGHFVNWTATDDFPFVYRIYINGTNTELDLWSNYSPIPLILDNLELGTTNVTIVILDLSRNSATHTIFVTVLDNVSPISTQTPIDGEYIVGTDLNLIWELNDNHPDNYILYLNGNRIDTGFWTNDQPIVINIGKLELGYYNFTIMGYDTSMNSFLHSVYINIAYIETELDMDAPTSEVYEGYTDTISGKWVTTDNVSIQLGNVNGAIYDSAGIKNFRNFSTTVVNGQFTIDIDYSQLNPDTYILFLEFEKFAHENHTLIFEIEVYGHQLDISIEYEEELIQGENYTISIRVTYDILEANSLTLSQSGGRTGPVRGIHVNVIYNLKYNNGTIKTYEFFDTTDFDGYVILILSGTQTKNLQSFDSLAVTIETQNIQLANRDQLSYAVIPEIIIMDPPKSDEITIPIIGAVDRSIAWFTLIFIVSSLTTIIGYQIYSRKQSKLDKEELKRKAALEEIKGLQSIKQILLINQAGLPLYQKEIQKINVDPLLLSGISSAFSSFLREVSDQQMFGIQIMENQGLSITSHKLEYSNLILISSESLPFVILNQIMDVHPILEEKFKESIRKTSVQRIDSNQIEPEFKKAGFKIALRDKLKMEDLDFEDIDFLPINKEVKSTISLLPLLIDDDNGYFTLNELFDFYEQYGFEEDQIGFTILTAYNHGIIRDSVQL